MTMHDSQPQMIYLKDYLPSAFLIDSIHLHFELADDETHVTAVLAMRRNPASDDQKGALILNGEAMSLLRICLDGAVLAESRYQVDESTLTITDLPQQFVLETEVAIQPQNNTALMGLYQSSGNYCTQCEAEGFRRITYYLDRPDVLAEFTTTISADKDQYPYLLSNGNLIEEKSLENNRHWVKWHDPSVKPCYLFALVAGDFDVLSDQFVTQSGRQVKLKLYLERGYKDQGDFALRALKNAMQWDEQVYGREYDLDIYMIVAVSDFNMGAMENKGLNIFNTKYILAKPETATDNDYIGIEGVIGHEYFHNWTGNRITCRDWFQITLKEGLTVFRDQSFTETTTSAAVARLGTVNVLRNHQFPEDKGPTAHPIRPQSYIEINNFYTATVYRKGAEVIRMIRTLIGDKDFHRGMDLYFARYDGQAVTTEDFVNAMAEASGKDLTQFKRWYSQAGTPELTIESHYDHDAQSLTLTVSQMTPPTPEQADKKPLHLPLAIGLVGQDAQDMPTQLAGENIAKLGTRILEVHQQQQSFEFINVQQKPIVSLLRQFSAPVVVKYPYSDSELLQLLKCDSDTFSRWEAGQLYMRQAVYKLADKVSSQTALAVDSDFIDAVKSVLTAEHSDLYYLAQLVTLPALSYVIEQMPVVNIDAATQAYQFLRQQLASAFVEEWQTLYAANQLPTYRFSMQDVAKRSIANRALFYLAATGEQQFLEMAYQQFVDSHNMTDRLAALVALNNQDTPLREQALSEFYDKYQDQPLVVNKWLSLIASSSLPGTLDHVKQCMTHPGFSLHNPNNVYALIGGFAQNVSSFHHPSGDGYKFVMDQVLAIDPKNPQVAGRIVLPLTRWQSVDQARQQLMIQQLQRGLAVKSTLSTDCFELITKSLASVM